MPRLQKKSVTLSGHGTSLALEPEFWSALQDMAAEKGLGLAQLVLTLDETREARPLASVCRVAALAWARSTSERP